MPKNVEEKNCPVLRSTTQIKFKKNIEENDFLVFGFTIKIKYN